MKYLILFVLIPLFLFASSLREKYPSYSYVLEEFDIDTSYAHNDQFISFVKREDGQMQRFYRYAVTHERWLVSMIRRELLEKDMSDLFLYLSIVESGLRTEAVSPKKAAGLWQFMPKTARAYSLQVCNSVDERCDPVSATHAAIRHLRNLYTRFGKWYLAVLAYNCGEGRLSKAIAQAGTDEITVLLDDDARYLPKETREYLKKILLISMIGESETISMNDINTNESMIQVEVAGGTDIRDVAALVGIDAERILRMNPVYKKGMIPNEKSSYQIMIPEEAMIPFYIKYHPKETKHISYDYLLSHYIILGETLESIAQMYRTDVESIKNANGLKNEMIEVNTLLLIPVSREVFRYFTDRKEEKRSSRDKVK